MAGARKPRQTAAERLRRHREIFAYAIAHRLSLHEAERQLARVHHQAVMEQVAARRSGAGKKCAPEFAPWLLRD